MTVAEVFRPDGNAVDMINSMYDILIAARLPFGVAELQDGRQLFVLGHKGAPVHQADVAAELLSYLTQEGLDVMRIQDEMKQATIDVV